MALVADIVKIDAPASANAGETVIVDVSVKNLGLAPGGYNYIAVTAAYGSTVISFQFDYLYVAPQETVIMRGNFIMPSSGIRVTAWSWYWDGAQWQVADKGDDTAYVDISLTALVSAFSEFGILGYSVV